MAWTSSTDSSSVFAVSAPIVPDVVEPHVGDEDVGAGLRHRASVLGREDIRRSQEIELAGCPDQLDLESIPHPCLLEVGAEGAVDQADGREVLDAGEAQVPELPEEDRHEPEGIRAAHAGEDRSLP